MSRTLLYAACACAVALAGYADYSWSVDATVRSSTVRHAFVRAQACPVSGLNRLPCPGYIIDHKQPLDCGGADTVPNLQWLTVDAWRAKSKWERSNPACEFQTKGAPPKGADPWWKFK